jgi:nucleoside-diphosphate-sugar epimerase
MHSAEFDFVQIAVVGASGPTGFFLCEEFKKRGSRVRAVARSRDALDRVFAGRGIDTVSADALNPETVDRAVAGCDLVVDCIGLPADRMADHPRTARNLADAARKAGARCLQISSYWAYLPIVQRPVTERHPRRDGVEYVRHRREAEDILQAAGAAVVNLPDFYGPRVHSSTLQQALLDAVAGKPMSWIGRRDTPREYVYVPDAARTIAALARNHDAYGQRWIVPGAGPLTATETAEMVRAVLGERVKLRTAGLRTLRLLGLFLKPLREFLPMVPYYVEPISFDGTKLAGLIGEQQTTPYSDGIRATLDWLRKN